MNMLVRLSFSGFLALPILLACGGGGGSSESTQNPDATETNNPANSNPFYLAKTDLDEDGKAEEILVETVGTERTVRQVLGSNETGGFQVQSTTPLAQEIVNKLLLPATEGEGNTQLIPTGSGSRNVYVRRLN